MNNRFRTYGLLLGIPFIAVIAAIAVRVAAAADSSSSPAPAPTPALVTIQDFAFSPASVSIPVGGSVTWKNLDTASHTATDASGSFDSGNLDTGKSYTHTFNKAGTYAIVCSYHSSMHGTVIVGGSATPAPSAYP
jgi:plastocyanin